MIGSLNNIQATAEKLSIPQLQQAMRDGTLPPYVGIPLLQKKVQMQKQMQMASQMQQPKKPSIAEQVNQEATADEMMRQRARMMQAEMGQTGGISDFLPKGEESYAKGGPIAFAEKGYVDPAFIEPEDYQNILRNRVLEQRVRNLVSAERARPFPELSKKPEPAIQAPYAPGQAPVQPNTPPPVEGNGAPVTGNVAPAAQTPYAQAMPAAPSPIDYSKFKYSADETDPAKLIAQREAFYGEDKTGQTLKDYLAQQGEKVAKEEGRAPWLALMQAGLATMAGTSPFAMANIGAGGIQGLNAYTKAQDKLDSAKEKMFDLQSKYDMAKRAEHVSAVTSGLQSADTKALKNKTLDLQEAQDKQKALVDEREFKLKQQELGLRGSQVAESARHNKAMEGMYSTGLKPYQADQLRKGAVAAADKVLSNMLSPEYKEFSALKTKAEKDQYKQNLVDSYFARYTGAVPSASATAQAPYDLNWAQ